MAKKIGGLGRGLDAIFIQNETEDGGNTVTLNISEIEPNRNQPRRDFDEEALNQLAESIKFANYFQSKGYQIVAGERRYRACRLAGITEVPVTIRELTDEETMEIALIENLQREDLNPIEEALGYKALMDEHGLSQEAVADAVGKSRPAIANTLRLINLPDSVSEMVRNGKISAGHARALLSIEDTKEKEKLAEEIAASDLSVRQVEKLVKKYKSKPKEKKTVKQPSYYTMVEQTLSEYLGKKVKVKPLANKKGGTLSIEFYSDDELKDLAAKLEDK